MFGKISNTIDTFNDKMGEWTSLLILPLLIIVLYEVAMRYLFNAPTTWGFEATAFLYGMHYMFGLAYTDVHDSHVKVDIFSSRMPKKIQRILSILTTLIIFLPVISCMAFYSCTFAFTSLQGLEKNSTSWAPPIWPFKIIMAVTFIFLLAQGISNLIKDVRALILEKGMGKK